jgi:hypothetical protein
MYVNAFTFAVILIWLLRTSSGSTRARRRRDGFTQARRFRPAHVRAIGTELRDRTCSGEFRLLEMPERTGGAINQDKSKQRYRPLFNTPSRVV